jgi:alkanesulfonate monooxygenase SsuD/methylene tetrahydromethanopterin reductase-like flavin-dependent oxidoreductase (luciferase family)
MRLDLFAMEYDPAFLERFHPRASPADGITRRAVLARYAAALGRDPSEALFEDVAAVHLALTEAERARLFELCRAFAWEIDETEGRWTCRGPHVRLEVAPSEEPGGVTALELRLRRPADARTLTLGDATLELAGRTATLTFR